MLLKRFITNIEEKIADTYTLLSPAVGIISSIPYYFHFKYSSDNFSNFNLEQILMNITTPIALSGLTYIYGKSSNSHLIDPITKLPNEPRYNLEANKYDNLYSQYCIAICSLQKIKDKRDEMYKYPKKEDIETVSKILKSRFLVKDNKLFSNSFRNRFTIILPNSNEDELNLEFESFRSYFLEHNIDLIHGIYTKLYPEEKIDYILKQAKKMKDIHTFLHNEEENIFELLDFTLSRRDKYTQNHSHNVSNYSLLLGLNLNLSFNELMKLELISKLHDLGKIGISDYILNKEGKLTLEEYITIQKHSEIGYEIATHGRNDLKEDLLPILYHHERYNGSGYPTGIAGEKIPFLARIIAVADTYSAITESRTYKSARTPNEAFEIIESESGKLFDPKVVSSFLEIKNKILDYTLNPNRVIDHTNIISDKLI